LHIANTATILASRLGDALHIIEAQREASPCYREVDSRRIITSGERLHCIDHATQRLEAYSSPLEVSSLVARIASISSSSYARRRLLLKLLTSASRHKIALHKVIYSICSHSVLARSTTAPSLAALGASDRSTCEHMYLLIDHHQIRPRIKLPPLSL